MTRFRRLAATMLVLFACSDSEPPAAEPGEISRSELEALRALGYVQSSPEVADPNLSGARILAPGRVSPGYSLYTTPFACRADLIDVAGSRIRSWNWDEGECVKWMRTDLLANGDVLVLMRLERRPDRKDEPRHGRWLTRFSWDGELLWRVPLRAHHDVEQAPDGTFLALTRRNRKDHDLPEGRPLEDNEITRLGPDGRVLDTISLWDLTRRNPVGFELSPVSPRGERKRVDLFHANAVESMRRPELADRHPLYAPGNLLVTVRHQDTILVIDPERRELVWAWGRGVLSGPHDARVLDDGHILVFDNGLARGWSRVLEIDPLSGEIVWKYQGNPSSRFFTVGRGSSQRLPNGNTLIANSNFGEAFEVTPEGQEVWHFWNPWLDDKGHRQAIIRMIRYDATDVEPLGMLSGRTP